MTGLAELEHNPAVCVCTCACVHVRVCFCVCLLGWLLLDEWPVQSNEALEKLIDDPTACSLSCCFAPGIKRLTSLLVG